MPSYPVISRRHRGRACLLLLFLTPLLAGCGAKSITTAKVQDTLVQAYRYAQVDPDDKRARQYVDSALALAPNDPATYFGDSSGAIPQIGIAGVFGAVGDDPALIDYMKQAVQKFPDDERGGVLLVEALGRQGRVAEQKAAAANLVAVLTRKIQKPGATDIETLTLEQAQAQFDAGDAAGGAATYRKAIQAYPNSSEPVNGLAYAYAVANDRVHLPEALALAQKALTLAQKENAKNPDDTGAQVAAVEDTLAWVQHRLGDEKDAEQNLLDAVGSDPRMAEMRFHLGSIYAAEGKTDAARTEFGHAVLLCPGYAAAQQALNGLPKQTTSS